MNLNLRDLKPNPFRDFTVDPIDKQNVKKLVQSIHDHEFWGGVTARRHNGSYEIAAGHHRVQAALDSGLTSADIFVGKFDDADMIHVYAVENATQRGNTSAAVTGSVAAAIRFISKGILTGSQSVRIRTLSERERKQLTNEQGLGFRPILDFLKDVPGIDESLLTQCLSLLKSSGDYARIIAEVQAEIEEEQKEALKALAKAEREREVAEEAQRKAEAVRKEAVAKAKAAREEADKARAEEQRQRAEALAKLAEKRQREAEKQMEQFEALKTTRDSAQAAVEASSQRDRTFDSAVGQVFKNPHQLEVFKKIVTGEHVAPFVAVRDQLRLAKHIVSESERLDVELTASFIREQIMTSLMAVKHTERTYTKEQQARIVAEDFRLRWKQKESNFTHALRMLFASGEDINELLKTWPKGLAVPITSELRQTVTLAIKTLTKIEKGL